MSRCLHSGYIRLIKETNFYSHNNITVVNQIINTGIYNFPGDYTNIQMPISPKKVSYEFYIVSNTRYPEYLLIQLDYSTLAHLDHQSTITIERYTKIT